MRITLLVAALAPAIIAGLPSGRDAQPVSPKKHVLAWADVRGGYQHESISHALATVERLGR